MQAQAAEFPGYAGKFDCFLERIVMHQFDFGTTLLLVSASKTGAG